MEVFVARQAIFDKHMNVIAYELLFRKGNNNNYAYEDGDSATLQVILNSFSIIGLDNLTSGKKAFINFTENLIKKQMTTLLPKDLVVIEILENVIPSKEVIEACLELKKKGYVLALDDYDFKTGYNPFLDIVDIVKVDFLSTTISERAILCNKLKKLGLKVLAEKVENKEEFHQAIEMGYDYFQGYFFSKPNIISEKSFPQYNFTAFRLIEEIGKDEINFEQLENIIKTDIAISYKLLRFINSATFSFRREITSIKHALVLLGKEELTKWILLVSLGNMGEYGNVELMNNSIIRGRFCENVAGAINSDYKSSAFMLGTLSMLDAFLDKPMEDIVKGLPIKSNIKSALIGEESLLGNILKIITSYENGDSDKVLRLAQNLNLDINMVYEGYLEAILWTNTFVNI